MSELRMEAPYGGQVRSGINFSIIHHEVPHGDEPDLPERSALEPNDCRTAGLPPKGVYPSKINMMGSPVTPTMSCTFPG